MNTKMKRNISTVQQQVYGKKNMPDYYCHSNGHL